MGLYFWDRDPEPATKKEIIKYLLVAGVGAAGMAIFYDIPPLALICGFPIPFILWALFGNLVNVAYYHPNSRYNDIRERQSEKYTQLFVRIIAVGVLVMLSIPFLYLLFG